MRRVKCHQLLSDSALSSTFKLWYRRSHWASKPLYLKGMSCVHQNLVKSQVYYILIIRYSPYRCTTFVI